MACVEDGRAAYVGGHGPDLGVIVSFICNQRSQKMKPSFAVQTRSHPVFSVSSFACVCDLAGAVNDSVSPAISDTREADVACFEKFSWQPEVHPYSLSFSKKISK
jgi:hypothetical protein